MQPGMVVIYKRYGSKTATLLQIDTSCDPPQFLVRLHDKDNTERWTVQEHLEEVMLLPDYAPDRSYLPQGRVSTSALGKAFNTSVC